MASQAFLSAEAAATSSVSVGAGASSGHSPFSIKGSTSATAGASSSSTRRGQHGFVSTARAPLEPSDAWGPSARCVKVRGDIRGPPGIVGGLSIGHDPSFHHSSAVLTNDFCGRRSTRQVSKLHFGRPKLHHNKHSPDAKLALQAVLSSPTATNVSSILCLWSSKLYPQEDFAYILRELGNAGDSCKVIASYEWAITQDSLRTEWCKLLSITISTLGRLGKVSLAQETFDKAVLSGFGRNVYSYSALISAYGRSGQCGRALQVFEAMKKCGCKPNLITYNAVIDACGKGGVDYKKAMSFFEEMEREGVDPDRITFNSLIAVCSRGHMWEEAQKTFEEMQRRGIDQDIFTYNTVVDAVCKSGKMDRAAAIVASMHRNSVKPNVVTYSTLLDGYGKAGRYVEAVAVYEEMKSTKIVPDRVSYNTLVYIYAKLGKFEDALLVCRQMEKAGWKKDAVTYNALLDAYGKQGKYREASELFKKMKSENVSPSVLTYSTLIDTFSKGGLHKEALQIFKEFKEAGLKLDVVLYSSLIDALCKSGLVDDATNLLDEMIRAGIRPNVVTFNSIIDAYGRNRQTDVSHYPSCEEEAAMVPTTSGKGDVTTHGRALDFSDLSINKSVKSDSLLYSGNVRETPHKDILAAVRVFQEMWELGVKPNVVTFSAILHACSRCASFVEAASLLEELRQFDRKVYGVAHGLLMGFKTQVWQLANVLFDEVARMDHSTAAAFFNALADVLWHFGQKEGAQKVVLEARRRQVWVQAWQMSEHQCCLDLHLMSVGAAQAMLNSWLLNIRAIVFEGHELPKLLSILTGWGRHSKVAGECIVKQAVESHLLSLGAPFKVAKYNEGRLVSTGPIVGGWLLEPGTLELLVLHDTRLDATETAD
ncbi:hypothetical protein GOP47_0011771 [Adiantum capillus-veneris]|uniref:Smr domain-containing protein n=1 Tax=Adiantum capillus-veneris TaxID=13818 RepID=A0A9D4UUR9_ADICA|nr:hypothetical protein GOP47_0011771 [Adiantum capillus-veneris]